MSNSEEWKDATVTQEGTPPLYQQGRFPSVVDTDDLVFELGKQVVDKINKEKLLDSLVKKIQPLEEKLLASESIKADLVNKAETFKASNELYVQNNEKLSAEITRLRNEHDALYTEYDIKVIELMELKNNRCAQIARLEKEKEDLRMGYEELKMTKASKKRK